MVTIWSSCLLNVFMASWSLNLLNTCSESCVTTSWSNTCLMTLFIYYTKSYASLALSIVFWSSMVLKDKSRLALSLSNEFIKVSRSSTYLLMSWLMWSSLMASDVCPCSLKGNCVEFEFIVTPSTFSVTLTLRSLPILSLLILSYRALPFIFCAGSFFCLPIWRS